MSISSHLLERAIRLWKSGEKQSARQILQVIIYNDRHNEAAWIWYVYSLETNTEKTAALESFLEIFPGHELAVKALGALQAEERQPLAVSGQAEAGSLPVETVDRERSPSPVPAAAAARSGWKPALPWILALMTFLLLVYSSIRASAQYNALQSRYRSLESTHQELVWNFGLLSEEHQVVETQYQTLQDDYRSREKDLQALQDQNFALQAEHRTLQDSYSALLNDYDNSVQSYEQLKDVAIVPPYIYIRGRDVYLSFLGPDQQTYNWSVPFDLLEADLRRGNIERNKSLSDEDYPRLLLNNSVNGETYRIIDYRRFVDPAAFTSFSRYFYERAPSDEAFIEEMWYIVAQLTAYSTEINDTPRYPLETLLAGGGDCEDHAILFASMILASAPPDWTVDLVYMDADHPYAPQTMNHVVVYINTGTAEYTIEATGKQSMQPYLQDVNGWYSEIED